MHVSSNSTHDLIRWTHIDKTISSKQLSELKKADSTGCFGGKAFYAKTTILHFIGYIAIYEGLLLVISSL